MLSYPEFIFKNIQWFTDYHSSMLRYLRDQVLQKVLKPCFRVASGKCEYRTWKRYQKRSRIQLILLKRHRRDGFFLKENQSGAKYLLSRAEFHFLSLISLCEEGRGKKQGEKKLTWERKGRKTAQRAKTRHPKNSLSCLQIRSATGMWSQNDP